MTQRKRPLIGLDQREQEIGSDPRRGLLVQLDEGKFRRVVDRHGHVELAFGRANFGEVEMEPIG